MRPSFSIGIPTLNRFDLLLPALIYYSHDFPDIRVLISDNGLQCEQFKLDTHPYSITKLFNADYKNYPMSDTTTSNPGVAASWNWLIGTIFKDDTKKYAVILNDDIYWGREQEDFNIFLAEFEHTVQNAPGAEKGFILAPIENKYDWSVFVISRQAWETIGPFDKGFYPAYFEDCDYKYRAKLAGVTIYKNLRAPVRFMHSGSVKKDRSLLDNREKNYNYYVSKWGGEPGKEIYVTPFNEKINS